MKACLITLTTALSFIIPVNSWGQTPIQTGQTSLNQAENNNICAHFSTEQKSRAYKNDAPVPVRTLDDINTNTATINVSEEIFYQKLGLIPSQDGGYMCLATDTNNERRNFTVFKVKKVDNILVVSTFLEGGNFLAQQEQATTNLFLEMIQFYTNIPEEYYSGINNYFQEFYLRIADGRLKPSSDRVYAVDEPSTTVVMYHPLQGQIKGTAISLNIPLP